jgi:hypothetical protein
MYTIPQPNLKISPQVGHGLSARKSVRTSRAISKDKKQIATTALMLLK